MSELSTDVPSDAADDAPLRVLHGQRVCPGTARGRLRIVRDHLAHVSRERIERDAVEDELNRFRTALEHSRRQLADLRSRLTDEVGEEDARILDTHLALTKDSAFIADVENLILDEQFALESAIGKVVGDFDRIFRLVNSEQLRRSAADLRDVGLRVLRNLEARAPSEQASPEPSNVATILVAPELSVIDLLDLTHGRIVGVVSQDANTATHAAVLARSLRVPTLGGVERALEELNDGDWAVVDADAGLLHVSE
ncbi:MAG: phosphoenolpyruvate-utilizing N-terminal domain-containing protein, partial [Planctomycetota bacterium]